MNQGKKYFEWFEKNRQNILELLERNPSSRVVDLGCGNGEFTKIICKKIGCPNIIGIDIDKRMNSQHNDLITFLRTDLEKGIPLSFESLDVIICSQIIEHMKYPIHFFNELFLLLKDNGYLVISTENLASWDNIGALILGYTPFSMGFDGYRKLGNPLSIWNGLKWNDYPGHVRVFTLKGLIHACEVSGFRLEKLRCAGHILSESISGIDKYHTKFITLKLRKK